VAPAAFGGPDEPPPEEGYSVPALSLEGLVEHPARSLPADVLGLIGIWVQWRGGGMGAGPLPFGGGTAEQPAIVMAALSVMEGAARALEPERGDR
jgi:hypothetical protein